MELQKKMRQGSDGGEEGKIISNDMSNANKAACVLCGKVQTCSTMRSHTKAVHNLSISDYKRKFGDPRTHVVDPVYHKCGLCGVLILLDGDSLASHCNGMHKMVLSAYSSQFLITKYNNPTAVKTFTQKPEQVSDLISKDATTANNNSKSTGASTNSELNSADTTENVKINMVNGNHTKLPDSMTKNKTIESNVNNRVTTPTVEGHKQASSVNGNSGTICNTDLTNEPKSMQNNDIDPTIPYERIVKEASISVLKEFGRAEAQENKTNNIVPEQPKDSSKSECEKGVSGLENTTCNTYEATQGQSSVSQGKNYKETDPAIPYERIVKEASISVLKEYGRAELQENKENHIIPDNMNDSSKSECERGIDSQSNNEKVQHKNVVAKNDNQKVSEIPPENSDNSMDSHRSHIVHVEECESESQSSLPIESDPLAGAVTPKTSIVPTLRSQLLEAKSDDVADLQRCKAPTNNGFLQPKDQMTGVKESVGQDRLAEKDHTNALEPQDIMKIVSESIEFGRMLL